MLLASQRSPIETQPSPLEILLTTSERMPWVDTAKGLSIILVVMMYSAYNTGEYTGTVGFLHYVIGFTTPFRMPEFFLISGLFLAKVISRPWLSYADRRIVHYAYFYVLWAAIMIGLKVGLYGHDLSGMLRDAALAIVEPYGVLWFIYMLAIFGLVAKLIWQTGIPHLVAITFAVALQLANISTASTIANEFAAYFVFFYAGYALGPLIFRLVDWAQHHSGLSIAALLVWALGNGLLVFSSGFSVQPTATEMGLAAVPPLRLALAVMGGLAICVIAGLLVRFPLMDWLRWLGEHSLVIYVSFTLPMSIFRGIALNSGLITETGALSFAVLLVSLASPALLYAVVKRTRVGTFLFERPNWARIARAQDWPVSNRTVQSRAKLESAE